MSLRIVEEMESDVGRLASDRASRFNLGSHSAPEVVWYPAAEHLSEWDETFHQVMLEDTLRMRAFEAAIREVVKPCSTVVDLGTGTGILAQWALEQGATRVYGIEMNASLLQRACSRIKACGLARGFVPLEGLSYDIDLPERVDVVVSETIGNVGDNEDFVPILTDARRRFLKPDGVMIPDDVTSYLAPVTSWRASRAVADRTIGEIQPSAVGGCAEPRYYDCILPCSLHLAAPQAVKRFRFQGGDQSAYERKLRFAATRDGVLTGWKGYFVARLSERVTLDTSGTQDGQQSLSWKHAYFPAPARAHVRVAPGDVVATRFVRALHPGRPRFKNYSYTCELLTRSIDREDI